MKKIIIRLHASELYTLVGKYITLQKSIYIFYYMSWVTK